MHLALVREAYSMRAAHSRHTNLRWKITMTAMVKICPECTITTIAVKFVTRIQQHTAIYAFRIIFRMHYRWEGTYDPLPSGLLAQRHAYIVVNNAGSYHKTMLQLSSAMPLMLPVHITEPCTTICLYSGSTAHYEDCVSTSSNVYCVLCCK